MPPPSPCFCFSKTGEVKTEPIHRPKPEQNVAQWGGEMLCLSFGHILTSVKMTLSKKKSNGKTVEKLFLHPKVTPLICLNTSITLPNMNSVYFKREMHQQVPANFYQTTNGYKHLPMHHFPLFYLW